MSPAPQFEALDIELELTEALDQMTSGAEIRL
jgi:hypothetical protein